MSAPNSLFVRAAKAQPTERTPVWFMRQAGRYMPEYRAVRSHHSLLEICRTPELAAEVTAFVNSHPLAAGGRVDSRDSVMASGKVSAW